jgi:hypothetical protein
MCKKGEYYAHRSLLEPFAQALAPFAFFAANCYRSYFIWLCALYVTETP